MPLLVGMTADANLITANREGILLVLNQAINVDRDAGTYSVNLVQTDAAGNQITEEVEVTLGLRDGDYTQITGGLQAGDQVMVGNAIPVQQFGPGQGRPGMFGGGS